MKTAVFLFLLLNLSAAAEAATVRFQTRDGCFIEADYLKPSSGSYVFVNAHGLGSDKNEWGLFQEALSKSGSGYLSLDLRGHGRSVRCGGKSADYRAFSEADWAAASNDITAAAAFLKDRGVPLKEIIFCGASVGVQSCFESGARSERRPSRRRHPVVPGPGVRRDTNGRLPAQGGRVPPAPGGFPRR